MANLFFFLFWNSPFSQPSKAFQEANGQKIQRAHHQCLAEAGAARRECK